MAKAIAICRCATCGKEFEKTSVKKNRKEADSWETWAVRYYDECDECEEKRIKERRAAENAEAADLSKEAELPELTGSEKQVAWAGKIRWDFYERSCREMDTLIERSRTSHTEKGTVKWQKVYDECVMFAKWLFAKTEASFWIDKRGIFTNDGFGIRDAHTYLMDMYEAEYTPDEVAEEAVIPTIIEPDDKTSVTVCEISATENEVTVRSAKDQGVITLVKIYGFRWNGSTWSKEITVTSGTARDRLVEIGNKLLLAGFPIKSDPKYHDAIINGDYEPETLRWITELNSKPGVVKIQAASFDFKVLDEASKMHGARHGYGNFVLVPVSAWEEIMDFANVHDFKLTPGAIREIDTYKASMIKASPVKNADAEYHEEDTKAILDSSRDVLDDLKEED